MPRAKPKKTIKIVVGHDEWTCHLWRSRAYIKKHGDDSMAMTTPGSLLIDFRDDELSVDVVAHELTHAYFKYLHLDSTTNLQVEDFEEIVASWLGTNFMRFAKQANELYDGLRGTVP